MSSPSQRVSIVDGPAVGPALEADGGENENGASPGLENDGGSSPTAIIADEEGDASASSGAGLGVGAESAVNVTNDAGAGGIDGEEEEEGGGEEKSQEDSQEEDAADDESEYSYDYEDEEAGQYSGFLIPTDNLDTSAASLADDGAAEEDDRKPLARAVSRMSDSASPVPETNPKDGDRKQKWREPTRAAVNMSLRAEKEKTGGRRRLASDLYKTMMADTQEAGFSLEPSDEDSMEKWCIKLFGFDEDSNLAKDLLVCGTDHVQLEMSFPDQYPFEPPFVRVVQPRFKRQTGFVMSGALCMELLTKDGWNPINDIESVIVSIRSLMVVGDGRLQAAADMKKEDYKKALREALKKKEGKTAGEEEDGKEAGEAKRKRAPSDDEADKGEEAKPKPNKPRAAGGSYSAAEAQSAYDHLSSYHKKEGWDKNGWWSRKG